MNLLRDIIIINPLLTIGIPIAAIYGYLKSTQVKPASREERDARRRRMGD